MVFSMLCKKTMHPGKEIRMCADGRIAQLGWDPSLKPQFQDLGLDKLQVVRATYLPWADKLYLHIPIFVGFFSLANAVDWHRM
jgi:hypothetical protein